MKHILTSPLSRKSTAGGHTARRAPISAAIPPANFSTTFSAHFPGWLSALVPALLPALLAVAQPAQAAANAMFKEENDNNRVERILYTENKVVQIGGIINQPFLIEFKDDEPIDDVAGGAISGWEVHKKGYRLFIRALAQAKPATLLVTARNHTYVFDLLPRKATPENFERRRSKVIFDYPHPAATALATSLAAPLAPIPPANQYHNDHYSMQVVSETVDIRPREVYDDGRFTWFKFPANQEIPAIYRSVPKTREEVLVNSHREGDYIVLHATAPLWNLRLAESVVGVFNESYDADGVAPVNGATAYGLSRESKQ